LEAVGQFEIGKGAGISPKVPARTALIVWLLIAAVTIAIGLSLLLNAG
jgi:hypothetical protein